jgi:hypothetical protein
MRSATVAMIAALAFGGVALALVRLAAQEEISGGDVVGSARDRPVSVEAGARRPAAAMTARPDAASTPASRPPVAAAAVRVGRVVRTTAAAPFVELAVNGGPATPHGVGDAIAPGVRVARIEADAVWIERAGGRERLAIDDARSSAASLAAPMTTAPAAAEPAAEPSIVAISPGRANPARPTSDRAIATELARQAEAAGR